MEEKPKRYEAVPAAVVWDKALNEPYHYSLEVVEGKYEECRQRLKEPRYKGLTRNQRTWQGTRWHWESLFPGEDWIGLPFPVGKKESVPGTSSNNNGGKFSNNANNSNAIQSSSSVPSIQPKVQSTVQSAVPKVQRNVPKAPTVPKIQPPVPHGNIIKNRRKPGPTPGGSQISGAGPSSMSTQVPTQSARPHPVSTPGPLMLPQGDGKLPQYSVFFQEKIQDFDRLFMYEKGQYHARHVGDQFGVNILLSRNCVIENKNGAGERMICHVAYVEPIDKADMTNKLVLQKCETAARFLRSWYKHVGGVTFTEADKQYQHSLSEYYSVWRKISDLCD